MPKGKPRERLEGRVFGKLTVGKFLGRGHAGSA